MAIHIDPLEKQWFWVVGAITAAMLIIILWTAVAQGVHPPSNVEAVNAGRLHLSEEFREENLGVHVGEDGAITVVMVAARYGFFPLRIEVPANRPVTFRMATPDVIHGVHAPGTSVNVMLIPGYVSQISTVFPRPGEYPFLCNEYCGLGHDYMWSRVSVVPEEQWQAP